jgi:hypothetical protein
MDIEYYLYFGEYNTNNLIWNSKIDHIEQLAGMLAVGTGILEDLNYQSEGKIYFFDTNVDILPFRITSHVDEDNIKNYNCDLQRNNFGLWMKSDYRFRYNLYTFATAYFMQGVISMCASFNVDFRNYIFGFPFIKDGTKYSLYGYEMIPFVLAQDAPDLNDMEEENEDDENMIEPLKKDY